MALTILQYLQIFFFLNSMPQSAGKRRKEKKLKKEIKNHG